MPFFRLKVPYRDKEVAKSLGAKWYSEDKYWYYSGNELPDGLRQWYPGYEPVEGRPGVYIDTETGEIIGESESQANIETDELPFSDVFTKTGDLPFSDELTQTDESPILDESSDLNTIPVTEKNMDIDDIYDKYKSVSEINDMISGTMKATEKFRHILVKGEVTNYDDKRKGKHFYFAIKDETALLPCVMWEGTASRVLNFKLEKGQQVAIAGNFEFYEATGKAQLIVNSIENIGEGKANLAFLRLKEQLRIEGLFDSARKRPIPKHPSIVGIITSKNGQAILDIQKIAKKRNPYIQLVLYHVNVQGVNAVKTIVEGIKTLDAMGLDTIIVGRGGGSDEELKAYNSELVARAASAMKTPIISSVGHQGNSTLIDDVADKFVATPSEAAEEAIPDVMKDIKHIADLDFSIRNCMASILKNRILLLDARVQSIEKNSPQTRLKINQDKLSHQSELLNINIEKIYKSRKDRLGHLSELIDMNTRTVYKSFDEKLRFFKSNIELNVKHIFAMYKDRPQNLRDSLDLNIKQIFEKYCDRQSKLQEGIESKIGLIVERHKTRLDAQLKELIAHNPTAKLINGFGYVTKEGKAVQNPEDVDKGDKIDIQMKEGHIEATVDKICK